MITAKVNQVQQDLNSCSLFGPESSLLLLSGQKVGDLDLDRDLLSPSVKSITHLIG